MRRGSPPLAPGALHGQLILVTGGTGGIGLASARYMAAAGAEVHVTGRDAARGAAAVAMASPLDGQIIFHQADLGSVTGARDFVHRFSSSTLQGRRVDILVQNLATMHAECQLNADGHERSLGTNLLNFYVIAHSLRPHFAQRGARMINVVSAGQHLYKLHLNDLQSFNATDASPASFDGIRAYSLTHRARVLLTERWSQSSEFAGISMASVHPGWVETAGLREAKPMAAFYAAMKHFLRNEDEGADTVAWLSSPSVPLESEALNGGYFWDRQRRSVDLPLSGTACDVGELDRIAAWLDKVVSMSPSRK